MEIQKTNNILDEDIQALSWYTKGCRDTLLGVGIGAALAIVGCIGQRYITHGRKRKN